MTVPYLVTADDVCGAIEDVLKDGLVATVTAMEWTDLKAVATWHHVPNLEAITTASHPAGAIESPGLSGEPRRTGVGGWEATWRVVVGVYDRGRSHDDTASRVRRWAAAVRGTVLADPSLDGLASHTKWVSEMYAQRPEKNTARTLGGCAVSFDVTVPQAVRLPFPPASGPFPTVTTTHTSVTVR